METIEIPEHKRWAIELSEEDYLHEFQRRYPSSDYIPSKSVWLDMPIPENRMIDSINPESMLADDYQSQPKKDDSVTVEKKAKKEYFCRGEGCDRVFTAFIGQIAHERKCARALNTKL